jgi:hypothetical protein
MACLLAGKSQTGQQRKQGVSSYFLPDFFSRLCRILLAFSSSLLRDVGKVFPARFRKYCIIRMPEPMPFGLTFFEAICLATVSASLVNTPFSGKVDDVATLLTQCFFALEGFFDGIEPISSIN